MNLKSLAKSGLLAAMRAVTGRHPVLLPAEAADEENIFQLSAPYRVEGDALTVRLTEAASGHLRITLLSYEGHFPKRSLWSGASRYEAPVQFSFDLSCGEIRLGDRCLGSVAVPLPSRRFCCRFELETRAGAKRRLTGHYLAAPGRSSYFDGDNYVDYEAEARGEVGLVLDLFDRFHARGPVLEIGCATGLALQALAARGLEVYGLDASSWAVEQAQKRLAPERVFLGDPEEGSLPDPLLTHRPFGTLLLWAVLEHFHQPFGVLRALTPLLSSGATLFINTTNAQSLNRLLFGAEWEGYFDASHHGVDAVSADSLRTELPSIGWRIVELRTHLSWDSNVDPTHAALRECWASDARFRRLLTELDRGDLITCVAIRE